MKTFQFLSREEVEKLSSKELTKYSKSLNDFLASMMRIAQNLSYAKSVLRQELTDRLQFLEEESMLAELERIESSEDDYHFICRIH